MWRRAEQLLLGYSGCGSGSLGEFYTPYTVHVCVCVCVYTATGGFYTPYTVHCHGGFYTPPRQFSSSCCKVWEGAKSRHSFQKQWVSINAVMGQKSWENARGNFSWNHLTRNIWAVMHSVKAKRIAPYSISNMQWVYPKSPLQQQRPQRFTKPPNLEKI